jgi:hypothetical protein
MIRFLLIESVVSLFLTYLIIFILTFTCTKNLYIKYKIKYFSIGLAVVNKELFNVYCGELIIILSIILIPFRLILLIMDIYVFYKEIYKHLYKFFVSEV